MALIKCPECGKEVSDKAEACIHCGYPIAKEAAVKQATGETVVEETSDTVSKEHTTAEETLHADTKKTNDIPEQEMTNVLVFCSCGPEKNKCAEKMGKYNSLRMNYRDSKHFINKVKNGEVNPAFYIDKDIRNINEAKEELEALGCTLEIKSMPEDEAKKLIPPKTTQEIMAEARAALAKSQAMTKSSQAASAGPKCPTCGSTDIQRIGAVDRVVSTQVWGLSSKKINKTFKRKKCGYSW